MLTACKLKSDSKRICGKGCLLQQDNALILVADRTVNFLKENNINVLQWPSLSPELNSVENVWEYLGGKVDKNRIKVQSGAVLTNDGDYKPQVRFMVKWSLIEPITIFFFLLAILNIIFIDVHLLNAHRWNISIILILHMASSSSAVYRTKLISQKGDVWSTLLQ